MRRVFERTRGCCNHLEKLLSFDNKDDALLVLQIASNLKENELQAFLLKVRDWLSKPKESDERLVTTELKEDVQITDGTTQAVDDCRSRGNGLCCRLCEVDKKWDFVGSLQSS